MALRVEQCPACDSPRHRETGPLAPPIVVNVAGVTFEQPAYRILECLNCGLLYRDCALSVAEFEHYYSLVRAEKWEIASYYPTERAVLEILRKLPARSRILDFGCSSGRLLARLTSLHECYGLEINHEAARAAAEKGLRMVSLGTHPSAGDFDVIILVDVFEHLSAPTKMLRELTAALRSGGSLIIVTGNGDAAACRRDPAAFWYFREIEHACMITRRYADRLAAELRLELVTWTSHSHYDLTWREKFAQAVQNFAYWQFRNRTYFARAFLRFLPLFRRLRHADAAPTYSASRDHIVAVFEKLEPAVGVEPTTC